MTTTTTQIMAAPATSQREGDISSVFASLSGGAPSPLPPRFADVKRKLIQGREEAVVSSWHRLLKALEDEVKKVEALGSLIIPSIKYDDLVKGKSKDFEKHLRERGAGVIRDVVPQDEARAYKTELEAYIKANPSTKAFPANNPAVFELYWSTPQLSARTHPRLLNTQRLLLQTWHLASPNALISRSHPISYADRVRIRQPGDAGFGLGPHVDGGSCERWEETGYGVAGVYESIWAGCWEEYDPWEASCRLPAQMDLYGGLGCSMFRMFQGWLSIGWTAPREGTLLVNPMLRLTTAYYLLRPFFAPVKPAARDKSGAHTAEYLAAENWKLESEVTAVLQGATPGMGQELTDELHPHLQLSKAMVHMPKVVPGDYVVWHCDTIHAVDKVHQGTTDASVLYIGACPLTESNAEYLARQRDTLLSGTPGPDFPGGVGESLHVGRPTVDDIRGNSCKEGLQALGLEAWSDGQDLPDGEQQMLKRANEILGLKNRA